MRFYTVEKLGATRSLTPEGYLLCQNAPLARTGSMLYGAEELKETGLKPKPGEDFITIYRRPEEVFDPRTIASYAGKPLCDDHPDDDVTPDNYAKLAKGTIMNPRRGEGADSDLLIGDILVTDPKLIDMINRDEKLELSAGYDAEYAPLGPGEGIQRNIIVNHVALVADGRCGPRCRIGDSNVFKEIKRMKTSIHALLHKAFKAKDSAELEKIVQDAETDLPGLGGEGGGSGEHHVHLHLGGSGNGDKPMADNGGGNPNPNPAAAGGGNPAAGGGDIEARMTKVEALLAQIAAKMGLGANGGAGNGAGTDPAAGGAGAGEGDDAARRARDEEARKREEDARRSRDDETIEGALEMEAPPGTDDGVAGKAKDSSYLGHAFQVATSQIEIIIPGARFPTFDRAAKPRDSFRMLCGMRTETLERAYGRRPELAEVMDRLNNGRKPDFKKMTCDTARTMIAAVSDHAARLNNGGGTDAAQGQSFGAYAARHGNGGGLGVKGKIATPADLNKFAREHYKNN